MLRTALWLVAVVASLTIFAAPQVQAQEEKNHEAMIGKPAPDIKGDFALNGEPVALSDLKGKVVLVDFWAVWCGPCIATFPHLREWHKEFGKEGFEILGVTTYYKRYDFDEETGKLKPAANVKKDKDEATGKVKVSGGLSPDEEHVMLKKFAKHHELQHRLMAVSNDEWKKATTNYSVRGIPTAVLIDREGNVRMIRVGSGEANAKALQAEIRKLLDEKK